MLNARVASSFLFSVLIVVAAAVALYRPETPPASALPDASGGSADAAPPPTPGIPWADPPESAAEPPEAARSSTAMVPAPQAPPRHVADDAGAAPSGPRPSAEHPARSAFIRVAPGESLADLARRVYGTADAAPALWSANRDQLSRPDQPLTPGTILRTP